MGEEFDKIGKVIQVYCRSIFLLLGFFLMLSIFTVAFAQQQNCPLYADMAVTSKALALESVDKTTAKKVVFRMYVPQHPRAELAMLLLVDRAYSDRGEMQPFVEKIYKSCMEGRGNPDLFLGTST